MKLDGNQNKIEDLAKELSAVTGEPTNEVIIKSLEEKLDREKREKIKDAHLKEKLLAIAKRYHELPTFDDRSADEILGYK